MTNPTPDRSLSSSHVFRRRGVYVFLGVLVFSLGVVSRVAPINSILWDKYLGDALYAVMFYLCLAIVLPQQSLLTRTIATIVFVICIECFQLTGIPLAMRRSESFVAKLVSIVLGTKFGWGDMLAYLVGILAIVGVDLRFCRREPVSK